MSCAHAAAWRWVFASAAAALATAGRPGGPPPAPPLPAHACGPAACLLERPTAVEFDALVAEANRMVARYAGDPTPLGQQCAALGATMRARATDVRMLPYLWRATDPEGNLAPVTGDAHPVEVPAGTGLVHIARGFDALNPDRGLPAILQTARHEFAHLNGLQQREGWGIDAAAQLATACGAP